MLRHLSVITICFTLCSCGSLQMPPPADEEEVVQQSLPDVTRHCRTGTSFSIFVIQQYHNYIESELLSYRAGANAKALRAQCKSKYDHFIKHGFTGLISYANTVTEAFSILGIIDEYHDAKQTEGRMQSWLARTSR